MEILLIIIIISVMIVSANHISDRMMRSRYDPLPKPPTSISRTYRGEVSEAILEHERKRQGRPKQGDNR